MKNNIYVSIDSILNKKIKSSFEHDKSISFDFDVLEIPEFDKWYSATGSSLGYSYLCVRQFFFRYYTSSDLREKYSSLSKYLRLSSTRRLLRKCSNLKFDIIKRPFS